MDNKTDTKSSISVDAHIPEKVIDITAKPKDAFYRGVLDEAGIEAVDIDPEAERRLLRKLDLRIIPGLWLLFLCAFVDRINIGNARIQGLEKDLHMKGNDYNIALFTFFITYILFEVPSNLILQHIRPSIFLSGVMAAWGIVTIGQGVTGSFAGLVVCRLIIGFFEAGFLPGAIYLISMYYKRHELQWRISLFFTASIIAGAFSGLFAYAIANMDGTAGYSAWRWIFIIEGLITIVVAAGSMLYLPDWPHEAKFLTPGEKSILSRRLALDVERATMNHWDRKAAKRCFKDPKIWLGVIMYLGVTQTGYAGSFFTPTILNQLGWTAIRAQVMSIPIYVASTVITLTISIISDRTKHRFGFVMLGCFVATIGYSILLAAKHVPVGARYFAVYAITIGGYIAQPTILVWLSNNMSGHYKRGFGTAMQTGLGNLGGIVASNIYLPSQSPAYPLGFGLGLGFIWMTAIAAVLLLLYLLRENELRDQGKRNGRYELPMEIQENLGDDHPSFRFTL